MLSSGDDASAVADSPSMAHVVERDSRQVSGVILKMIFRLLERRVGAEGIEAVLKLAGETRGIDELQDAGGWSTHSQTKAILEATSEVLGDPNVGVEIGAGILEESAAMGLAAAMHALGSPSEAIKHIGVFARKYYTNLSMTVEVLDEESAIVTGRWEPQLSGYRLACDMHLGMITQMPVVFGLPPAIVIEEHCVTRGDACCTYRCSWTNNAELSGPPDARVAFLERQVQTLQDQIGSIQETVAEFISANSIESLAYSILERASSVIGASQFVLMLGPSGSDSRVVYQRGLDQEAAFRIAQNLSMGDSEESSRIQLTVEIASPRRSYGQLVVIHPPGTLLLNQERHALAGFAGFAAVALDALTAGNELRAQTVAAEALFDLTRDLAAVSSIKEVAYRVATMVPRVLPSEGVVVWLWDEEAEGLRPMGFDGLDLKTAEMAAELLLRPHESTVLDMIIADHEPVLLGIEFRDSYLEELLEGVLDGYSVLIPIVAGGRFQGLISASVGDETNLLEDEFLLERLRGIADQTSMAFTNARLVERVRHQAMHDSLTGLPNQRLFEDRVRHALAASRRSGEPVGLFFLDLDRFKEVNDSLGHGAGDDLLGQVAHRLSLALREEDTVARLGGDEFVLLISRAGSIEALEALAGRIQDSLREHFMLGSKAVYISSSIGIVLADPTEDDYQTLVRCADVAMYRAKSQGRDRYAVYSAALDQRRGNQIKLEGDLERAIESNELQVLYQPLVELSSMQIVGVEALVRWEHPKLGMLTPESFIPMAEDTGLIVPVDTWVLQAACRQARSWIDAGFPPLLISINLSVQDLRDPSLGSKVRAALDEYDVDPSMLEVEISEREVDGEDPIIVAALASLKQVGVKVAIDDFGTGGSGLRQLRSLPIDTLKIDKSFVSELTSEDGEAPLLAAMISMAHDLRVLTVAEGVESVYQGTFLRGRGCDLAQGYFFSHPITSEAITRLLAQR